MRISLSEALEKTNQQNIGNNQPRKFINQFFIKGNASTFLRFLVNDISEVNAYSTHRVRMVSKAGKQYPIFVGCIGKDCPLCKEAPNHVGETYPTVPLVTKAKDIVTIPLVNYNNGQPEYQILAWSTFMFKKINPMLSRINPLSSTIEMQRTGSGLETNYFTYPADTRPELAGTVEELKQKFDVKEDDIFGRSDSLIRDWSATQMEEYLTTGNYPHSDSNIQANNSVVTQQSANEPVVEQQPIRRTNYGF